MVGRPHSTNTGTAGGRANTPEGEKRGEPRLSPRYNSRRIRQAQVEMQHAWDVLVRLQDEWSSAQGMKESVGYFPIRRIAGPVVHTGPFRIAHLRPDQGTVLLGAGDT